MDTNNQGSDNITCAYNINDKWKRKSTLEKKLIIALVIITLVLLGLLLFIIIKHAVAPKVCKTSACILAASQIISHIDPSVDPCEDFFQFACGNYIKTAHGDLKASSIKRIEEDVQRQLAEIIQEPIMEDENKWMRTQKMMFQACMNETAVEKESLVTFKKTLEELNGWPVLSNTQWNEITLDWKYLIYKLRNDGYPHSILLDVGIEQDPVNKERCIVLISLPYVSKIKEEHKKLYVAYMTDVAVIFGAPDKNRAANEMEKILDFHDNLRKIYMDAYMKEDTKTETRNYTATLLEGRKTVEQFQELNGDIMWLDFINTIRTIYNYIIWTVIEEIIPYMSRELKQRWGNYTCLTGEMHKDKNRYEFCKNEIYKSLFRPLDVMYARKHLPINKRKKVEEIFANIKSEFTSALENASWMDKESKTKALQKVKATVEIVGAPGDYFNDIVFKQLLGDNYVKTEIQNGSYFPMLLSQQKILTDMMYFKMHMKFNDIKQDGNYRFVSEVNAMYSMEENMIIIPVGILQGVFYNEYRPMYLNYGAIGSIIGHELTHGFGEFGSKYETDGYGVEMWTNATLKAFEKKSECIVKEANKYVIKDSEVQINGTSTLEENLADYTGFKVSYAAYKKWVQQNGKEPHLPSVNYTPNQLFWISAVSYECFKINKYSNAKKDAAHAHNSFRVTAPLRNNYYFGRDFNCPIGSKMNPEKKCQVF